MLERSFQSYHEERLRQVGRPEAKPAFHPAEIQKEGMEVWRGHGPDEYRARVEAEHGEDAGEAFESVLSIARAVEAAGGRALLVGGSVRDEALGRAPKDFDVEVYGLDPKAIERIAETVGKVDAVGRAFGILKVSLGRGMDIDLSLPRVDSKVGEGHRGFEVKVDPHMSVKDAARRRDFTFNALAKDPLNGEIFDPFGGVEDLRERTLRVTDPERFVDDPLRVYRAAQFVGRFGLRIETSSHALMESMVASLRELPKERRKEEWEKMLLKSERPSLGLMALHSIGVIKELYPELYALRGTEQEFEWHPEGDAWIHTLMVTDSAADIVRYYELDQATKRIVMWAALCHDFGKPSTTLFEDGRVRSKGHESAGAEPAKKFLDGLGMDKTTTDKVVKIVMDHLWPGIMYLQHAKGKTVTDGLFRRLAKRIAPSTIAELTYTAEADHRGRGPFLDPKHLDQFLLPDPYVAGDWVRRRAAELGVEREVAPQILQGRDLIAFGFDPSTQGLMFGECIRLAEDARDGRGMSREQVLELISSSGTLELAIDRLTEIVSYA